MKPAAHFHADIARAMLARAVGDRSAPEGFGRLLSP
jgi:hypothetical protein